MASKVADRFCIPLSQTCHRLQHGLGWKTFAAKFLNGVDPVVLSCRYWAVWPGRKTWEAKHGNDLA